MATKLTFKREPRDTGLAAVANPTPNVQIKLKKKQVGELASPNWRTKDNLWRVRFVVKDSTQKAGWKWITLTVRFKDEDEGRAWVTKNTEQIVNTLNLHQLER
jgi:hypothetical protein